VHVPFSRNKHGWGKKQRDGNRFEVGAVAIRDGGEGLHSERAETYIVPQSRILHGLVLPVTLFPARSPGHPCCHHRLAVGAMVWPLCSAA
jgi:hypothetical protein